MKLSLPQQSEQLRMLRDLQSTNEQENKTQDSESKSEEVHEMYRKIL